MADQLRILHRGRLQVSNANEQVIKPEMTDEDRKIVAQMLVIPGTVWVAHTPEFEIIKGGNEKLLQFATAAGYRRETVAVIPDNFGRNVYEVYRLVK
jgi:hypothetical protein